MKPFFKGVKLFYVSHVYFISGGLEPELLRDKSFDAQRG